MILQNALLILVILFAIVMVVYLLWVVIPGLSGLPWIPTRPSRIRRALELARLSAGDIFYDLGSGDGRVLILAASEYGAYTVGIEISPLHCILTSIKALSHGVHKQVRVRWGNFYKADISKADVVFVYMTSKIASRLRPHFENQLHPGARVITISCEISGWQPVVFDREELICIYQI